MGKVDLYPHNQKAFEAVLDGWKTSNRVAVVHPTGTGKSYLILSLLEKFKSKRKLVLAPTDIILSEFVRVYGGEVENTLFLTYRQLSNYVGEVGFLASFDIVFLDEYHRCGAKVWASGVDKLLSCNEDSLVLGTSATPIRYLDGFIDMTDVLFDGNIVSHLSLEEAMLEGILPVPKYVMSLYTIEEELNKLEYSLRSRGKFSNGDISLEDFIKMRRNLVSSNGVPNVLRSHSPAKGVFIVFCSSSKHLEEMKTALSAWYSEAYPDSSLSVFEVTQHTKERDKLLKDLENATSDIKLLFSVNVLIEGVHLDNITGVILFRPTSSPRVYLQQIGRALSSFINKQPLILDFVNNLNTAQPIKDIKSFIDSCHKYPEIRLTGSDISEAFTIHDYISDFVEVVNRFSMVKARHSWSYVYSLVKEYISLYSKEPEPYTYFKEYAIGVWWKNQKTLLKRGKLTKSQETQLDDLSPKWREYLVHHVDWFVMYDVLCRFVDTFKRFPKSTDTYEGYFIGRWFHSQIHSYRTGELEESLVESLLKLEGFSQFGNDMKWERNFILYKEYFAITSELPSSVGTWYKGVNLSSWFRTQLKAFNSGRMSEDRVCLMDSVTSSWRVQRKDIWTLRFYDLKEYLSLYGCFPVTRTTYKGFNLGRWLVDQRNSYKRGTLSSDRVKMLDSLNLNWKDSH